MLKMNNVPRSTASLQPASLGSKAHTQPPTPTASGGMGGMMGGSGGMMGGTGGMMGSGSGRPVFDTPLQRT